MVQKNTLHLDNLNELEQYVFETCFVEVGSRISCWMSPAQRSRFPEFSSVVMDIFYSWNSLAKRDFSRAKHTISNEKSSLYIDTIKALKCLKYWFQVEIFTQEDLSHTLHQQLKGAQIFPFFLIYILFFHYLQILIGNNSIFPP